MMASGFLRRSSCGKKDFEKYQPKDFAGLVPSALEDYTLKN